MVHIWTFYQKYVVRTVHICTFKRRYIQYGPYCLWRRKVVVDFKTEIVDTKSFFQIIISMISTHPKFKISKLKSLLWWAIHVRDVCSLSVTDKGPDHMARVVGMSPPRWQLSPANSCRYSSQETRLGVLHMVEAILIRPYTVRYWSIPVFESMFDSFHRCSSKIMLF